MNLPEFALLGGICFLVVFGCREKPLSSETDSILQALDREIGLPPALKTDLIPTKSPDTQQRQASFDTWIPEDELPSLQWEIVYLRNLPEIGRAHV